jgi:hypothetical protein
VAALILFTFLILLLCLTLCIILRAGLFLRRRNLTVPPKRCILIFHIIHLIPHRMQTGTERNAVSGLCGDCSPSIYMID